MATFGDTTAGGSSFPCSNDRAIAGQFTLAQDAQALQSITVFFDGSSTTADNFKGLIYADSGGLPGALLATSSAGTLPIGGTSLTMTISGSLPAGTYWIGCVSEGFSARWAADAGSGGQRQEAVTYASPAATFGTPAGSTIDRISAYVTFDPVVAEAPRTRLPFSFRPPLRGRPRAFQSFDAASWAGTQVERWFADELAPSSGGGATNVNVSDSAAGSDTAGIAAALSSADAGSGADTSAVTASTAQTDSGSGSDAATIAPSIAPTDSSAGGDASTINAAAGVSDSGAGADSTAISVALELSDSGVGSDAVSVDQVVSVSVSDSGSGSDAAALVVTLDTTDAGVGGDAADPAVSPSLTDGAVGADVAQLSADFAPTDSAAGADAVVVDQGGPINVGVSDGAVGGDAASVEAAIDAADSGAGVDTLTPAPTFEPSDSAAGSDAMELLADVGLSDTGSGADAIAVNTGGDASVSVTDGGLGGDSVEVDRQGVDIANDPKLIAKPRRNKNIGFKPIKGKREAPPQPEHEVRRASGLLKGLLARVAPPQLAAGLAAPSPKSAPIVAPPAQPVGPPTEVEVLRARAAELEAQVASLSAELEQLRAAHAAMPAAPSRDPLHDAMHSLLPGLAEPIDLSGMDEEPEDPGGLPELNDEELAMLSGAPAEPKVEPEPVPAAPARDIQAENAKRAAALASAML